MNTYRFMVSALCPKAPHIRDWYAVEVTATHRTIWAEDIAAEVEKHLQAKVSQEDLTAVLAQVFGAEVRLRGMHGAVQVESVVAAA